MNEPRIIWIRLWFCLLSLGLGLAAASILLLGILPVSAARMLNPDEVAILVTTPLDDKVINGNCTLREAIIAANINYGVDRCPAGGTITDTITFAFAGTISLTEQLPAIIDAGPVVIDGGSTITLTTGQTGRALWVSPDARLHLQQLTLTNNGIFYYYPTPDGSALYNERGNVLLHRVVITNNIGSGVIYNLGAMTITLSGFYHNHGGSIVNKGDLFVLDSTFIENDTGAPSGTGAAIHNAGNLEVSRSNFAGNIAESGGAAIYNSYVGVLTVANATFTDNAGPGAAIYNSYRGVLAVANATFADNATWDDDCDFEYNEGGAIINSGKGVIEYSTFLGGMEPGPWSNRCSIDVVNLQMGELTLRNSILASDPPITNCIGTVTDGGYNIDSQDTCGFDPANSSLINTDPLLGELANNGGPTWTYAPEPGSPAIDTADPVDCPLTDQRGVPRPFDGDDNGEARCDIGSFEVTPPGTPRPTQTRIISILPRPSVINQPAVVSFQVTSAFGVPTGTVTVTVADNDESCTGALTAGLGSCSLMLATPDTYTLTAAYSGEGDYLPSAGDWVQRIGIYAAFVPFVPNDFPPAIELLWSGIRTNPQGDYEMVGQVENVSHLTVYPIRITANLYDTDGNLFGAPQGTTALRAVFPGDRLPFAFGIGESLPTTYTILINWEYDFQHNYRPLIVVSQTVTSSCPHLTVSGTIRNDQEVTLENLNVIVEPGGTNQIYGYASLGQDYLLPGETTQFSSEQDYASFPCPNELIVQGQGVAAP